MSGRAKRNLILAASVLLFLAATAGACLLLYFYAEGRLDYALFAVALLCEVLGIPVLFHEAGHLLFGLFAGLRPVSFSFGWFTVSRGGVRFGRNAGAGETRMLPKNPKGLRGKIAFFSLGGAVCNLLFGALFFLLFFLLPFRSVLLFFAELAPFFLCEGVCALLPAELPAGPTDGAVLLGIVKRTPDAEVALRVMAAQGMLVSSGYASLPRELLFSAPVVREDLPAFLALSELKWQFLCAAGEDALPELVRFVRLTEYLPDAARREALFDVALAVRAEGYELPDDCVETVREGEALLDDVALVKRKTEKEWMIGIGEFRAALFARMQNKT